MKAEGHSISEHAGVIPWPKNLRKKLLCELRQCSFTAPKKCNFCSISRHKTLFTMKKEKHHSKWLTPLERYDWDNVFALFWGVNLFWFWRKTFFNAVATIWCPYLARPHNITPINIIRTVSWRQHNFPNFWFSLREALNIFFLFFYMSMNMWTNFFWGDSFS